MKKPPCFRAVVYLTGPAGPGEGSELSDSLPVKHRRHVALTAPLSPAVTGITFTHSPPGAPTPEPTSRKPDITPVALRFYVLPSIQGRKSNRITLI